MTEQSEEQKVDAVIAELQAGAAVEETKAVGWVKTHTAWAIGLASFVAGALIGAVLVALR